MASRFGIGLILLGSFAGGLAADRPPDAAQRRLGAYLDERHLSALSFGAHSHWLQPWRAYQETLPAQRFLDAQGVVIELSAAEAPDLIVTMLARHGVRHARIEIGWGLVNYWDESKLNHGERLKALLLACKAHGVRPLILINANSGVPVPTDAFERTLAHEAKKGDRAVELADVSDLKVGYSGLANLSEYRASEALITGIEGNAVLLSKPLPKDLGKAGTKVAVTTLRYRPFSASESDDYRKTVDGWKRYVVTVADFVADALGSRTNADRGFDLEIWNELSFGSSFLSINNYYEPKLVRVQGRGDLGRARPRDRGTRGPAAGPIPRRDPRRWVSQHHPLALLVAGTGPGRGPERPSLPGAEGVSQGRGGRAGDRRPFRRGGHGRHSRPRTRPFSLSITRRHSRPRPSCGTSPRSRRRSTTSPTVATPG